MAKLTTHYSAYIDAVLKRISVESQPVSFRGLAGSAAAFLVKHGCAVIVERRPPLGTRYIQITDAGRKALEERDQS